MAYYRRRSFKRKYKKWSKRKWYWFWRKHRGIKRRTSSGGTYYTRGNNGKGYYYDKYGRHEFDLDTLY